MKIGVLGGTFDPPHIGHLELAHNALSDLQLDLVLFIPNSTNPFKSEKVMGATGKQRLEMVRLMIADEPQLATSDIEITRGGPSFMSDTLDDLQLAMPGDYWLIIGADNLSRFLEWKQATRILRTTRLAVAARPGEDRAKLIEDQGEAVKRQLDLIEMPATDISSTEIRRQIPEDKLNEAWLHPRVLDYIRKNDLYRNAAKV